MSLLEKKRQYVSAAQLKTDEATKAIEAGEFENAATLQAEAEELIGKAEKVDAQIKSQAKLNDLKIEDTATDDNPTSKSSGGTSQRLPFEQDDDTDKSSKSLNESIYLLKYGETNEAVKAVANDLYGSDYQQKRHDQKKAFTKYVATGKLNYEEEKLLKTLIMLPEQIEQDVRKDVSYSTMKSTLQEALNDLGGYLTPEDYRVDLIRRMAEQTIVRRFARVVSTNRDAVEWPKLEGGNDRYTSAVRVTWIDEVPSDANGAETNPTFGMLRVPVHTVMARTDVSRNQLEDSAFNMISIIGELFAEAMAIDEDTKFLTGIGGDSPKGLLGNRSGAEAIPETGIESVVTGNATQLTADGLIDLVYSLPAQYRQNAIMLAARTSHRDLRKLKDGNSRYLWEPSMQAGEPARMLGYSIYESESVPTVAANSYPIVFGDMKGYLIVDRIGMSIERVEDTTTVGRNKIALFMRRRLGGQVIEPWRFKAQKTAAS